MAYLKLYRTITPVLLLGLLSATLRPTLLYAAEVSVAPSITPLSQSLSGAAKEHYDNARLLFDNGDFAGALLKFRLAYESSRDARLLWNVAACEKQQRHYAMASALIEQYLREGGSVISETERSNAQTVLDTLQPFVGQLELQVNEPGAVVYIDDIRAGETPLPRLRLDMGNRKLRVAKDGFEDWSINQNVTGGAAVVVRVELIQARHVGALQVLTEGSYEVSVDGARVGIGNWSGELPSGTHRLNVRSKGMLPYEADVVVTDKQTNSVRVALRPETTPVAAESSGNTWLWIAGGAVLAAGLVTGGYFLFRSGDPERPAPQAGTMQPGYFQLP
jgi:hypothetical protein